MKQVKSCIVCGKKYQKPEKTSQKVWEQRQFCSLSCFGRQAANTHLEPYKMRKGTTLGEATRFKQGDNSGDDNVNWKGDDASYIAKHMWVGQHFGKPQFCENCGTTEDRKYHWANISKEYRRDRDDWLRLCVPCHKRLDIAALGGKIKAKEPIPQPSKSCNECGTVFFKKPGESYKQWETKFYCSRVCSSKVIGRMRFEKNQPNGQLSKICEVCGKEFFKEKYMSAANWNIRRFCGRKCGATVSAAARRGKTRAIR